MGKKKSVGKAASTPGSGLSSGRPNDENDDNLPWAHALTVCDASGCPSGCALLHWETLRRLGGCIGDALFIQVAGSRTDAIVLNAWASAKIPSGRVALHAEVRAALGLEDGGAAPGLHARLASPGGVAGAATQIEVCPAVSMSREEVERNGLNEPERLRWLCGQMLGWSISAHCVLPLRLNGRPLKLRVVSASGDAAMAEMSEGAPLPRTTATPVAAPFAASPLMTPPQTPQHLGEGSEVSTPMPGSAATASTVVSPAATAPADSSAAVLTVTHTTRLTFVDAAADAPSAAGEPSGDCGTFDGLDGHSSIGARAAARSPSIAPSSARGGGAAADGVPAGVCGMSALVAQVREALALPLHHQSLFVQMGVPPPAGVLLHGPPGTGKTMIARSLCAELHVAVVEVGCACAV